MDDGSGGVIVNQALLPVFARVRGYVPPQHASVMMATSAPPHMFGHVSWQGNQSLRVNAFPRVGDMLPLRLLGKSMLRPSYLRTHPSIHPSAARYQGPLSSSVTAGFAHFRFENFSPPHVVLTTDDQIIAVLQFFKNRPSKAVGPTGKRRRSCRSRRRDSPP